MNEFDPSLISFEDVFPDNHIEEKPLQTYQTDGFIKFPDIEGFHNILKHVQKYPEHINPVVKYYGKVKLHGTNAGVTITKDGQVIPQSRTKVLSITSDNYGFAFFVESHKAFFQAIAKGIGYADSITLYGEWYGKGIQKVVSASQIEKKHFAIFAIQLNYQHEEPFMIIDEDEILRGITTDKILPEGIEIIPVATPNKQPYPVNLFVPSSLNEFVAWVNKMTLVVEENDPYIHRKHGIKGIGEGLVFYPYLSAKRGEMCELMFKSKGEKHGNVVKRQNKAPTVIAPEVLASQAAFVEMFVTPARLEQIADRDLSNDFVVQKTGDFLKHFNQDVSKESVDELVASGLEWKDVQSAVSKAARDWWIMKCKTV